MVTRYYAGNALHQVARLADWPSDIVDEFGDASPAPVRRLTKEEIAQYAKQLAARDAKRNGGKS